MAYEHLHGETREEQLEVQYSGQVIDPESNLSRRIRKSKKFQSLGCCALSFMVLILVAMIVGLVVDYSGLLPENSVHTQSQPHDSSRAQTAMHDLHMTLPSEYSDEELNCGETRAEAESRGCILDVMANSWIPKLCYDSVSAAEALLPDSKLAHLDAAGSFQFYEDKNHTKPLSYEQLTQLDSLKAYVLKGWHVSHCLYEWRGSVHAINRVMRGESFVWVRSKVLNEEHVDHCNEVLATQIVDPTEWDRTGFGLGSCTRLDVDWEKIIR